MLALARLELDQLLRDRNQPAFGHLLVVTDAIADIGTTTDEAPVFVDGAEWSLSPGRRNLEVIPGGQRVRLVEQGAQRLADALAIVEGDALRPVDLHPQRRAPTRSRQGEVVQLVTKEVQCGLKQLADASQLTRGWCGHP